MQEEAASEEAACQQQNQELRQKEEEAGLHSERGIRTHIYIYNFFGSDVCIQQGWIAWQ